MIRGCLNTQEEFLEMMSLVQGKTYTYLDIQSEKRYTKWTDPENMKCFNFLRKKWNKVVN